MNIPLLKYSRLSVMNSRQSSSWQRIPKMTLVRNRHLCGRHRAATPRYRLSVSCILLWRETTPISLWSFPERRFPRRRQDHQRSAAGAIESRLAPNQIIVSRPRLILARLLEFFDRPVHVFAGVHPTRWAIHPTAKIGQHVSIGPAGSVLRLGLAII